jgi:hypothetical protein
MDGGERGLSFININAGVTIAIVIIELIVMNVLKREYVSAMGAPPYSSSFLSLSLKMLIIIILLMKSPKGPLTIPIAVAMLLSLSPNQLLASFVTGFLR